MINTLSADSFDVRQTNLSGFRLAFWRLEPKISDFMSSQDATTDYVFKLWAWFEANLKVIIIATGVFAAVLFLYSLYSYKQSQKSIAAGEALTQAVMSSNGGQLAEACLKIASDYPGTPASQRALLEGGSALFTAGKYAEAQPQFQKFLETYPDNYFTPQAQLGVAASLDAQGKSDQAAIAYQRAAGQTADASVALSAKFALAQIAETQGKPADAVRLYEEITRAYPNTSMGSEAGMRAVELKTKLPAAPAPAMPATTTLK